MPANRRLGSLDGRSFSAGAGQFLPHGVATDDLGNVYVTDSVNDRIQKFESEGSFLAKLGQSPTTCPLTLAFRGSAWRVS